MMCVSLAEEKAGHCETVFPTLGAVVSLEKFYNEDIVMFLLLLLLLIKYDKG